MPEGPTENPDEEPEAKARTTADEESGAEAGTTSLDASGRTNQTERPSQLWLIGAISGLAALGLALLYTSGAVTKIGQIRDAGLGVSDVLPLVPLPQLLALGIELVIPTLQTLMIFGFLAGATVYFVEKGRTFTWKPGPRERRMWFILGALWLISSTLTSSPTRVFTSLIAVATGAFVGYNARQRRRGYVLACVVVAYLASLGVLIGERYVNPPPLAVASVITDRGAIVSGPLAVATESTWYVVGEDVNGKPLVYAVDRSSAREAVLTSRGPERSRSLLDLMLGREP